MSKSNHNQKLPPPKASPGGLPLLEPKDFLPPKETPFGVRSSLKLVQQWSSLSHVFSLVICILIGVTLLPDGHLQFAGILSQDARLTEERQLLLEAMDKIVRYEYYYREIHGRFTRDLQRLGLPQKLSHGNFANLRNSYELSLLEAGDTRLLVLATGKNDRVTMDERLRINANFILPPPHRQYLVEEAERVLALTAHNETPAEGLYSQYWRAEARNDANGESWIAVGTKQPVIGERRQLASENGRSLASLFANVGNKVRSRLEPSKSDAPAHPDERAPTAAEIHFWLKRVHQAEHIYKRERGVFASTWDHLAEVTSFDFGAYSPFLKLSPIEFSSTGYRVSIEGTKGELLGEQFVVDESGQIKQIRYTESIIRRLQESAQILQGSTFQITEVGANPGAVLDSKKSAPVQLNTTGRRVPSSE